MRQITTRAALVCGSSLTGAALAVGLAGTASAATSTAGNGGGSVQSCVAYAYAAIERHTVAVAAPPACAGLSRAQVSQAASTAIHMMLTSGTKAERRKQAIAAGRWARAMMTDPAPSRPPAASSAARAPAGTRASGLGLGGVSELAAKVSALLAWLATAASGAWVLARWLLAGGSLRRKSATAAPPAVTLGHAGGGALGLVLWVAFTVTAWVPLAWIALGLLAPLSGLGMGVLILGLPRPARAPLGPRRRRGTGPPVLAIVAHGVLAVTALLLVLMATIGAG